jgi:hypothetical protein
MIAQIVDLDVDLVRKILNNGHALTGTTKHER